MTFRAYEFMLIALFIYIKGSDEEALEGFDKNVVVELSDKTAVLNTECSDDELIDAIEEAGYDVKEIISE